MAVRAVQAGAMNFIESRSTIRYCWTASTVPWKRMHSSGGGLASGRDRKAGLKTDAAEREVLKLVVAGRRNKADRGGPGVSQSTVEAHRPKLWKNGGRYPVGTNADDAFPGPH